LFEIEIQRRNRLLHLSHRERSTRESASGEGLRSIERAKPLTPTLSLWERELTADVATIAAWLHRG
jgi:hypothetical protein